MTKFLRLAAEREQSRWCIFCLGTLQTGSTSKGPGDQWCTLHTYLYHHSIFTSVSGASQLKDGTRRQPPGSSTQSQLAEQTQPEVSSWAPSERLRLSTSANGVATGHLSDRSDAAWSPGQLLKSDVSVVLESLSQGPPSKSKPRGHWPRSKSGSSSYKRLSVEAM